MDGALYFALGAGLGLVGTVGGWWLARYVQDRRNLRRVRPAPPAGAWASAPTPTFAFPPGWPAPPPTMTLAPGPGPLRPSDPRNPTTTPELDRRLALSARTIAHLFVYRGSGPDDLARPETTQRGIAAVLGADQRALSKVLRRLVAAGVVAEERRHVRGGARRVKVYTLTRSGEAIAVDLRRQNPTLRDRGSLGQPMGPYLTEVR